jgi:hypothetical protein
MDLFMPWRIARNFIRAFFLTLILLIGWDLWRRLNHAAEATQLAVFADVIALGVVLFIKLASPLAEFRKQLKHFYRSWDLFFWACVVLTPLVIPHEITPASRQDGLLLLAKYAFFADTFRVCKISKRVSAYSIGFVWAMFSLAKYVIPDPVSFPGQLWERVGEWRNALTETGNFLLLIVLLILARRLKGRESSPVVQELGLNRSPESRR